MSCLLLSVNSIWRSQTANHESSSDSLRGSFLQTTSLALSRRLTVEVFLRDSNTICHWCFMCSSSWPSAS
jgi:hypothetical protein